MTAQEEGRFAPDLLAQVPELQLATKLRDAVSKLQSAADLAAYFSGGSDTLADLEKARAIADGLVDEVERVIARQRAELDQARTTVSYLSHYVGD